MVKRKTCGRKKGPTTYVTHNGTVGATRLSAEWMESRSARRRSYRPNRRGGGAYEAARSGLYLNMYWVS